MNLGPRQFEELESRRLLSVTPIRLADIHQDVMSSMESSDGFVEVGGTVLFAADDGIHAKELFKIDGTTASLFLDIRAGDDGEQPANQNGSFPEYLTATENFVFFSALGPNRTGRELFRSDGTSDGTVLVKDIRPFEENCQGFPVEVCFPPNMSSFPRELTAVGENVFFTATDGHSSNVLWKSDGTEEGTIKLTDSFDSPHLDGSSTAEFTAVGNKLFFVGRDIEHGRELWVSDGTREGTRIVKDIQPNEGNTPGGPGSNPILLTGSDGRLYFRVTLGIPASEGVKSHLRHEILVSDGTPDGTQRFVPFGDRSASGPLHVVDGGIVYFLGYNDGWDLWKSDGTQDGTSIVKDFDVENPNIRDMKSVGKTIYFVSNAGGRGEELWKTDGTSDGTQLVKDIRTDGSSSPEQLTEVLGTLYFTADDGENGRELWSSDGTPDGTQMVIDIREIGSSDPQSLTYLNGRLLFTADDGEHGREPWHISYLPGDANLDGLFNSSDLVLVFQAGEYEDDVEGNSTWSEGDWNGDGEFTTSDLVVAFQAGHYVAAAAPLESQIAAAVDWLFAQDDDAKKPRAFVA